jgi:hypothetical protein
VVRLTVFMPTVTPFTLSVIPQANGEHTRHGTHAASIMGNENPAQTQRKAGDPRYGKYGTRKLAKGGGIMRHFNVPVSRVLDFQLLVYRYFSVSRNGLRGVLSAGSKRTPAAGNISRRGV